MSRQSIRLLRFVESLAGQAVYVGVDVHKRSYSVALFSAEDGQIETYSCPACVEAFVNQLSDLGCPIAGVVYESGPTGFSLARALEARGFAVTVAAASRVPRGSAAQAKTDRLDASMLATYLARGLLKSIAIPTIEEEGYRSLVRRRRRLAELRGKIKQRIKGFLLSTGVEEPDCLKRWTKESVSELLELSLSEHHHQTLDSMVRELEFVIKEGEILRKQIAVATRKMHHDRYKRLVSVAGVGEVAASTFLSEVFRPERFNRPEEVTSFLGLAPVTSRSGQGPARAKLRPVGQRRLRSTLVEAAWQWTWRDTQAKELFNRHLAKSGVGQKAICVVARHLAIKLWRLAVDQQPATAGGCCEPV